MSDDFPALVCTGRAYDNSGQPLPGPAGQVCGVRLRWWRPGPDVVTPEARLADYVQRARVLGWRFGDLVDGGWRHAMCPACAKPDPVTAAHCRDLARSVGPRSGRGWS